MRSRGKTAHPVRDFVQNLEDFQLVERCLGGDQEAILTLQTVYGPNVVAFLMRSGAELSLAEEIVAQLWADLVVAAPGENPKLARYDGSCQLATWLNTVAMNRLLSVRRSQKRLERYIATSIDAEKDSGSGETTLSSQLPAPAAENTEPPLIDLLRRAIQVAFATCSAETFVLLQLAHGDGLLLRELGQIWDCNPGTVSRRLAQAAGEIERTALAYVRSADPLIELTWSDFSELCRNTSLGALGFE